jgi:hypothetical protein
LVEIRQREDFLFTFFGSFKHRIRGKAIYSFHLRGLKKWCVVVLNAPFPMQEK